MAKSILGIDIGTKSIKVVELINNSKGFFLSSLGEVPFPDSLNNILNKVTSDHISEYLKKLLSDIKASSKKAVCSIPSSDITVSIENMPIMTESELEYAMKWQLRKMVTGYPEEKNAFWDVLSKNKNYNLLVVSIEKIKLAKYMEIINKSGVNLVSLEIDPVSLSRVAVSGNESALIIHIGASGSVCILVQDGVISLIRYIKIGEEALIQALMENNQDYQRAKDKLYEFGLLKFESKGNVYQKISPLVSQITSEAKRMIGFFEEKNGKELKKIIISGGGVYIPDILNHFIQEFSKDVFLIDPWSKIKCPPNIDSQNLISVGPKFAVACGLAMRDF